MLRSLLVLALAGLAASCYSPSYGDCQVSCSEGVCPSGLTCNGGVCRTPGMTGACTTPDAARPDAGSIPFEQLDEAVLEALCMRNVQCGTFEDVPACMAVLGNYITSRPDLAAAIAAGKVTYDPAAAAACLADIAQGECIRLGASFFPGGQTVNCNAALTGSITDGGDCIINEECASKACAKPSACGSDRCCAGTCTGSAPPGPRDVGDKCTFQDTCIDSYCSPQQNVCVPYTTNGMTCSFDQECGVGNACRQSDMTCQPQSATGGPCTRTADCRELSDVCAESKCQVGGLTGFPCTGFNECHPQHYCKIDNGGSGVCSLPPTLNETCLQVGMCQSGYCKQPEGVCRARAMDGEPCDMALGGTDCESRYCDSAMLRCAPAPTCF